MFFRLLFEQKKTHHVKGPYFLNNSFTFPTVDYSSISCGKLLLTCTFVDFTDGLWELFTHRALRTLKKYPILQNFSSYFYSLNRARLSEGKCNQYNNWYINILKELIEFQINLQLVQTPFSSGPEPCWLFSLGEVGFSQFLHGSPPSAQNSGSDSALADVLHAAINMFYYSTI